jgi:hypothetical protein
MLQDLFTTGEFAHRLDDGFDLGTAEVQLDVSEDRVVFRLLFYFRPAVMCVGSQSRHVGKKGARTVYLTTAASGGSSRLRRP